MENKLLLVVGESGSGKTALTEAVAEKYGLTCISSYTTRPPRVENETGHIFVKNDWKMKLSAFNKKHGLGFLKPFCYNLIDGAFVKFHKNYYFATIEQLKESDFYVIDPPSAVKLKKNLEGIIDCQIIHIKSNVSNRCDRIMARGETRNQALNRIAHDVAYFRDINCDYHVNNDSSFESAVKQLEMITLFTGIIEEDNIK